jgi:26S proteasome regulatory subunit N10
MAVDASSSGQQEQSEEDAELQAALAMSMNEQPIQEDETMEDLNEDDALQRALSLSMNENGNNDEDEEMMSAVLGSLPGVDKDDERIQKALEDMDKKKEKK